MTFRPSDDVLEEMADSGQINSSLDQYYNETGNQGEGAQLFHSADDFDNQTASQQNSLMPGIEVENAMNDNNTYSSIDIPMESMEEIKAPDLSELLKSQDEKGQTLSDENLELDTNLIGDVEEKSSLETNVLQGETNQDVALQNKVSSEEATQKVDNIENSVNIPEVSQSDVNGEEISPVQNDSLGGLDNSSIESENLVQNNEVLNSQGKNLTDTQIENSADTQIANPADTQIANSVDMQNINSVDTQNSNQNLSVQEVKEVEQESENLVGMGGTNGSNLDFLVDGQCILITEQYKKIHRILFRWGIFILVMIAGSVLGTFAQVRFNNIGNIEIVNDSSINVWNEKDKPETISLSGSDYGKNIDVIVPYGAFSVEKESFRSKGNLVSYKGIILPQLVFIDNNSQRVASIDDFNSNKTVREDLENILNTLILGNISEKTSNLLNVSDSTWIANTFEGTLTDGFNLGCLNKNKLSDLVCDKFLQNFYNYGKYYDLGKYSTEISTLMKELRVQHKKTEPLCTMIKEYTEHSGVIFSDDLTYTMSFCSEDDNNYYKKLINFIEVENSLSQPELSDKVFDDSDLNAYKLLSAQQYLYNKFLRGGTSNENYIKSYLNFVQTLIDKDKGNNRFLKPMYKDLLYVFNMDYLYPFLETNSFVNLKLQVDQINNGNVVYGHSSLLNQLTTMNIVKSGEIFTGDIADEMTIDDIFAKYYSMKDRLKIRRVVSEDNGLIVQTEVFSNKIVQATKGETLKITVKLNRKGNVLYVDNIKVAGQTKLTDILNIKSSVGNVTFDAMLPYIDEQIGMYYQDQEPEEKITICDELRDMENLDVYVCDTSSIVFYKGDTEYNIMLSNGILDSFTISDEELESLANDKLSSIMSSSDNTNTLIKYIVDLEVEKVENDRLEDKLNIVDQFRIHFKVVPDSIEIIEGKDDEFLVNFTLGEFNLQAHYNISNHLLTRVSYVACEKVLEIKNLTIELSTSNESKLIEILNNPKVFFVQVNPAAYKKYQKMCEEGSEVQN